MTVEADVLKYLAGDKTTPGPLRQTGKLLEKATAEAARAPWVPEGEATLRVHFAGIAPRGEQSRFETRPYACTLQVTMQAKTVQLALLDDARSTVKSMMANHAATGYPAATARAKPVLESEDVELLDNGVHQVSLVYSLNLVAALVAV